MVSFFAEVKIFRFWPKTMDYNKAFLPKSRCFSAVLLLHSGMCYEAEICTILFLLRCPFRWDPFLLNANFSFSGQKPWTIYSPWFDFWESEKVWRKVYHPKVIENRNLMALVPVA